MESMLSSDLLNDSDLDYWNSDHNPLCSPTLISSSGDHTVDEPFFEKDVNQTIDSPFSDAWRKENNGAMEFSDPNSSSVWFENKENIDQGLNQPVSTNDRFFSSNVLCPSGINDPGFLNSLEKDPDPLLHNDVLATSSLYSPLKTESLFNDEEPAACLQPPDLSEIDAVSSPTSCQEKCHDMWRAVGIMETTSKREPLTSHNVTQPNKHFSTTNTGHYSVPNKMHTQSLSDPGHHQFSSSTTPLGWLHRSAQYPVRNHVRFRKSRCRKPLLHNFQSNFFRLPIQSKGKSPQLQMVKLIRSSAINSKSQTIQEEIASKPEGNPVFKSSDSPTVDENPELALMKTVDMPSGKRVEDIYVVPSVWITGRDNNDDVKGNSQTECSPNLSLNSKPFGHRLGDDSMYPNMDYHLNDTEACKNQSFSSFAAPPIVSPSHVKTNATMSPLMTEISWPEGGMNHRTRNLIITTLNAPKLDMVPCLKDLCKAVLNDNPIASQHEQTKNTFSLNNDSLSSAIVSGHSPESLVNFDNEKPDEDIHFVNNSSNSIDNSTEKQFCPEVLDSNKCSLQELQFDKEVSYLDTDATNPLHFQDPPILDAINSPNGLHDINNKEQVGFDQEDSGKHSSICVSYPDDLTATMNTLTEDDLPSLDAIINETPNPVSTFSTTQAHMTISNSCESVHSNFDNINEGLTDQTQTVTSLPEASSSSSFIDSPFAREIEEEESYNPPELITLLRQIKELHINDPINKPLSNLSTTLHLLYDAEKTLCNANFGVYQQLKTGQHSKFGRLVRCILSLTSTVVLMGKSLYEWTRSSSDHQCLKTVEVLSNLYHSNIINLIELITPYFHYLCGLIASCHSDILRLNKTKMLSEKSPEKVHSFGTVHPTQGINEAINDTTKNSRSAIQNYTQMPSIHQHGFNLSDQNRNLFCQNKIGWCARPEDESHKLLANPFPDCHKRTMSPSTKNSQKKPKMSLLKCRMPMPSKGIPPIGPSDLKTSLTDVKTSSVKGNSSMAKTVLINVNSNRMYSSTRPSMLPQNHVQAPAMAQNKTLYQPKSVVDTYANQDPCVVSYRAPLQNGSKNHSTFIGSKPVI